MAISTLSNGALLIFQPALIAEKALSRFLANDELNDLTWFATDGQRNWPAADTAILYQHLLLLRGIDFQGKSFSAMRTDNVGLSE
jgi:hypothetical protein